MEVTMYIHRVLTFFGVFLFPTLSFSSSLWTWLIPRVGLFLRISTGEDGQDVRGGVRLRFTGASRSRSLSGVGAIATLSLTMAAAAPIAHGAPPREAGREAPLLTEVRKAALRYCALSSEDWASMARRAGHSAWLPDLTVRVSRGTGLDSSTSLQAGDDGTIRLGTDDDLTFEVKAGWELGRLIFDREEIQVAHHVAKEVRRRQDLLTLVTRLYFERRRALARLAASRLPRGSLEGETLRLTIAEKTALLDNLTGGWFTQAIQNRRTP